MTTTERSRTKRNRGSQLLPIACMTVLAPVLMAEFSHPKISRDLAMAADAPDVDVLVQFSGPPSSADIASLVSQGGRVKQVFSNMSSTLVSVPGRALASIANRTHVRYISPNRSLTGKLEFAVPAVGGDIAFNAGWTGSGVGIAIVDSGVSVDHPDLKGRVVYSQNFVAGESRTDDPYGHGTHVAVVAGGSAAASTGPSYTVTFRGIAPRANLINLRVLDANGNGYDAAVIAAIDRAIELKSTYNIRVINLSLGRTIQERYALDPLCQAVERAWRMGIVVVVAAGNNGRDNSMGTSGYATITSPGNSPYVITVGAMKDMSTTTRADDLMTSFSSKGPTLLDQVVKPDLVAPGSTIVSGLAPNSVIRTRYPENVVPVTYYKLNNTINVSTSYFRLSGTSMAAPMVSGAAALLVQKNAALTADQVKARLMKTASKSFPATSTSTDPQTGATYPVTYDLFTVGAGYLDVPAALSNDDIAVGQALSPRAIYDAADGSISVVPTPESVWSNAMVWGTAIVWGTNVVVNGDAIVWGSAIVWGTATSQGFAIVWGSNTVWPTTQPFNELISSRGE